MITGAPRRGGRRPGSWRISRRRTRVPSSGGDHESLTSDSAIPSTSDTASAQQVDSRPRSMKSATGFQALFAFEATAAGQVWRKKHGRLPTLPLSCRRRHTANAALTARCSRATPLDQAVAERLRRSIAPAMPKPPIIIAQVAGSGTTATLSTVTVNELLVLPPAAKPATSLNLKVNFDPSRVVNCCSGLSHVNVPANKPGRRIEPARR